MDVRRSILVKFFYEFVVLEIADGFAVIKNGRKRQVSRLRISKKNAFSIKTKGRHGN